MIQASAVLSTPHHTIHHTTHTILCGLSDHSSCIFPLSCAGPAPGSSGRSQYDRTPAVNLDNLQLVVDVGPAAGGSTSAAAGRGPGGVAAANGGAAAGRGGAAGGEAGRPGPRGLGGGLAASSSSATNASSSKAPPPWLGKSGAPVSVHATSVFGVPVWPGASVYRLGSGVRSCCKCCWHGRVYGLHTAQPRAGASHDLLRS
jgi:hypothetical protein